MLMEHKEYNVQEERVEKVFSSQITKNYICQVHTLTQTYMLCTCKRNSTAECIGPEALRLDCISYHAPAP